MSHFTPQPWTKDRHGIYGPDGEKIQVAGVSLVLNGTAAEKAEAEANRDLLFAAPDMLSALRDCIDVMENDLKGLSCIQPELRVARAAYAKATGEAP